VFHVSGLTCGLSEISSRVFLGEVAWGITLVLSVGWEILGVMGGVCLIAVGHILGFFSGSYKNVRHLRLLPKLICI